MRVLELFPGTGSAQNVCKAMGMGVIPLDEDMPADIRCDITDWDYKDIQPNRLWLCMGVVALHQV